ncbi:MAG TPA: hypothetical protein VJS44_00680 [Pyrinomonadaceae bacterium]|nr:hypothetical protein [Pyrinomonadaceae bacterium]
MEVNLETGNLITEQAAPDGLDAPLFSAPEPGGPVELEDREEARLLGLWLRATTSFFKFRNHPYNETEQAEATARDWSNELRIARRSLLQCAQLALSLSAPVSAAQDVIVSAGTVGVSLTDSLATEDALPSSSASNDATASLAESLASLCVMCESMLEARVISFHAWSNLGKVVAEELERSPVAQRLMRASDYYSAAGLQAQLLDITRRSDAPSAQGSDLLIIFTALARMLDRLRFIESVLRRDQPLKFLLPVFTLLHEEARTLVEFIETRAMRTEGMDEALFDTLDGTNYAVSMELRKVFAHELVGLSELRQPTVIYAKVENAYGLLRDCFQQSTVALAQLFDPALEGAQLFDTFQTKLQQSLALRRDLWTLLLLVRRAERERDQRPVAPLLERLAEFREGSLRYLMYKDWEACERFMEEVGAARGAVELSPVLHRFGAYLETLHGQVNMRAVLANHPFDYPELDA